jgi:D-citramalate synthase
MNHLTHQLKTPEQHFTEIAQTIALASNNIASNVLRRLRRNAKLPDYVFQFLDFCPRNRLKEYYCLDTLGVLLKPLHLFQKSHRNIRIFILIFMHIMTMI